MKYWLLIILFISSGLSAKPLEVGEIPFDYLGKTLDGSEVRISDYKGKVVIVSFWATWCGPCLKELPVLIGIQNKVSTDALQVISINYGEKKKLLSKVVEVLPVSAIKMVSDSGMKTGKKYGVKGIPHLLIIDPDGKVAAVHIGYSEAKLPELVDEINEALRKVVK